VTGMSSSARFLDSNVLVYAVVKPKKNVDERLAKIKERAREIFLHRYKKLCFSFGRLGLIRQFTGAILSFFSSNI